MMDVIMDHAPTAGLLFFFCIFVWIAFRTYRPGVKHQLQTHAFIPLKEDNHG